MASPVTKNEGLSRRHLGVLWPSVSSVWQLDSVQVQQKDKVHVLDSIWTAGRRLRHSIGFAVGICAEPARNYQANLQRRLFAARYHAPPIRPTG